MSIAALFAQEVVETLKEGLEFPAILLALLFHCFDAFFVHVRALVVLSESRRAQAGQPPDEAFRGLVRLTKFLHANLEAGEVRLEPGLLFKNEFHGLLDVHSGSLLVVRYCCAERTITAIERAAECRVCVPPVCEGGLVITSLYPP